MTNYCFKSLILTALFVFTGFVAFAQEDNSIKGFVYEESTGEPMMFTNVYLKGTTFGGSTNENGYFNINRIPDGRYTLLITSVGYDTIRETFNLSKGQSINRKYYMKETSQKLETVTITADKIEARTETKTSVITVTPKTITKIPSIGGQADFAQYLQVVPGVIFTGDQGGQLYIRGGSPIQNKVLLDGCCSMAWWSTIPSTPSVCSRCLIPTSSATPMFIQAASVLNTVVVFPPSWISQLAMATRNAFQVN